MNNFPIIDCDIHNVWPSHEALVACFDEPYRSEVARYGLRQLASGIRYEDGGHRDDLKRDAEGREAGFDPRLTVEDHLDRWPVSIGLLTHVVGPASGVPDPYYAAALCRAMNDCCIEHWLPSDERWRMTIHVPLQDPTAAVREIERLAEHPQTVAVGLGATAHRIPLGHRFYWPIYEAVERQDLPLHLHPSTTAVIANASSMPSGMAANYLQSHTALPTFFMSDVISLMFEGVFEQFPGLRVALVEGGVSWMVHLLWRMDKEYKALRHEAPYLKRLPSAYIRDHVRLTTQPIEEPRHVDDLVRIFEILDADTTVMYASDYPHYDYDPPTALPKKLGETTLRRILHDNAAEFFRLPCATPHEPTVGVGTGAIA